MVKPVNEEVDSFGQGFDLSFLNLRLFEIATERSAEEGRMMFQKLFMNDERILSSFNRNDRRKLGAMRTCCD